jgi:hypothetical protein
MRLGKIKKALNEQALNSRQQTNFIYPTIAVGNSQIKNASNELVLKTRQETNIINPTILVGDGQI